jgi:hypothetical protein
MAVKITEDGPIYSPASRLMDEAIELAIQERSPFPDRAWFMDYDESLLGESIEEACQADQAVVLVWPDGSSRVLQPGARIPAPATSEALKGSGSGIDLPAA